MQNYVYVLNADLFNKDAKPYMLYSITAETLTFLYCCAHNSYQLAIAYSFLLFNSIHGFSNIVRVWIPRHKEI